MKDVGQKDIEVGILSEDERVELLEGEIVEMTPTSSRHAACVTRLNRIFSQVIGDRALVSLQNPVRLSEVSEPQPDLALLRPRPDYYAHRHPTPEDVLLAVEVADTSVRSDNEVKIPLYGRSGIAQAWLVNLEEENVESYRKPSPGGYQETHRHGPNQSLTMEAFPNLKITVNDVLP
ncbi:Uma2 family endonuclease [Acidobacteria bacterium AH-259-L09]|nr:Uma2 family endonuclease [Acidobacteria bacterium AH-259-L09]